MGSFMEKKWRPIRCTVSDMFCKRRFYDRFVPDFFDGAVSRPADRFFLRKLTSVSSVRMLFSIRKTENCSERLREQAHVFSLLGFFQFYFRDVLGFGKALHF